MLRILGIEFARPGGDVLVHRLLRLAAHAELAADAGRPLVFVPRSAQGLAALIREVSGAIDVVPPAREGAA